MTMEQIRAAVAALYASESWKRRVRVMSDAQILAIWRKNQK